MRHFAFAIAIPPQRRPAAMKYSESWGQCNVPKPKPNKPLRDSKGRFLRKHAVQPFAIASGRQLTVDTQRLFDLDRNTYWAKLSRWQKLTIFDAIYHSQELAVGAVNVIKRFVNSRPIPITDNPEIAKRMKEVWEEIDGHVVNGMVLTQRLVFGWGTAEWVSDDLTKMDRVVVLPSIEIRKTPDRQGNIIQYIQLPGWTYGSTIDGRRAIPPAKIIDAVRDPHHSFDYYGVSVFESAVDQFESLCKILDAQIRVYMRLGRPRFHVTINAEGLTPEQLQDRIDQTKQVFSKLGDLDSSDIYTPTGVEVKIIGAESFGQRFADETRLVVSNILAAVGIPPALLHVTIQSSAGAESYARQSVIAMQTMIDEEQRSLAAAWNKSFWPMVAAMEGWPEVPKMAFEKPRLLEQLQEEQARALRWENDEKEVVAGIRDEQWMVQRCGANDPADETKLKAYFDAKRKQLSQPDAKTPEGIKADSTTKVTDERATNNTSL
jgi:hypothetical protein